MTAKFIAFEGGEGTGKSTQAQLLAEALDARGIACTVTREPGGTPGAEAIRALLLDPALPQFGAHAEALLFAAARADHVAQRIRPALEAGSWVICDRFVDSSRAYQGAAAGLGDEAILTLHRIGSGGLLPDRVILLEASSDKTASRIARRDGGAADKIGGRATTFHNAVASAFRAFADEEPDRIARVDAEGSPQDVHRRVLAALAGWLQ